MGVSGKTLRLDGVGVEKEKLGLKMVEDLLFVGVAMTVKISLPVTKIRL